ncbi:MAG: right-handed parallel beta-helix repeat-containing protein [Anaerolineae bacterium]|nr:right-handed parallel beta-helix repeat-containing protein [Anaerolineae bacterium]
MRISLQASELTSMDVLQGAIDSLGNEGGRVELPAGEFELDRGIELRSNVALVGQGRDTVLRKAPGRVYALSGYHNYGMCDVPLMHTEGLVPGMTVAIRDDRHGGFFETFARITWVDGTWVGLDQGLHADYDAGDHPVLVTAFPLIFGRGVTNVSVANVTLDGNRAAQPAGIGACRGAALYFIQSHGVTVSDVVERDFAGEGLGFQMSSRVAITDCAFDDNAGNGFHPGAGSTAATFDNCSAKGNGAAGFFFCVRANHISVRACRFTGNAGPGVSVGTRDSHNLLEASVMTGNGGSGILFRETRRPVEVHDVVVRGCRIQDNARSAGAGQIVVLGEAHTLAFEGNVVGGTPERETAGFYINPSARDLWLNDNAIMGCSPVVVGDPGAFVARSGVIDAGIDGVQPVHFRHLDVAAVAGDGEV